MVPLLIPSFNNGPADVNQSFINRKMMMELGDIAMGFD